MYIFHDREYYVQKSLSNKLFEEKMKKSLIPLLPSIDHDICEEIAIKSHNLYKKIRLEFEREFTKGIWNE